MSSGGYAIGNSSGGTGTVTSVGLALPSIFAVTGSPVTTSGTLTGTLVVQNANKVFAGPTVAPDALPTFRLLVAADIPDLSSVYAKLASDNVFTSTGYQQISKGTTAQQPGSPATGMIRYNTTTGRFEFYNGAWTNYVQLSGDTMTGTLTAPTVALTTSLTLLDTTQKVVIDVSAAGIVRIGNGFATILLPTAVTTGGNITPNTNNGTSIGASGSAYQTIWVNNISAAPVFTLQGNSTVNIRSANSAAAAGTTGILNLFTGNETNAGAGNSSGVVNIFTGAVTAGTSGDINISTGTGSVARGSINIGNNATSKIAFYGVAGIVQPATGGAASAFVANTSLIANDSATWDGYTIGNVIKALRNLGILT